MAVKWSLLSYSVCLCVSGQTLFCFLSAIEAPFIPIWKKSVDLTFSLSMHITFIFLCFSPPCEYTYILNNGRRFCNAPLAKMEFVSKYLDDYRQKVKPIQKTIYYVFLWKKDKQWIEEQNSWVKKTRSMRPLSTVWLDKVCFEWDNKIEFFLSHSNYSWCFEKN